MMGLIFDKVIPTDDQIEILYTLLKNRKHKISLDTNTSFEDHKKFVYSSPYRAWFLIKDKPRILGSFYITNSNFIGLNLNKSDDVQLVRSILDYIYSEYKPLSDIPSIRVSRFCVNVAPSDTSLINVLKEIDAELAQLTYYAPIQ